MEEEEVEQEEEEEEEEEVGVQRSMEHDTESYERIEREHRERELVGVTKEAKGGEEDG